MEAKPAGLSERLARFHHSFFESLSETSRLQECADEWDMLRSEVTERQRHFTLDRADAVLLGKIAANVGTLVSILMQDEEANDARISAVSEEIGSLLCIVPKGMSSEMSAQVPPRRKRDETSSTSDYIPTIGLSQVNAGRGDSHPDEHHTKPTDHIREWFLQHLANPYPSAVEKDSLSGLSGIPRSKIDSDMTNWRRRAGWTDIKDNWANGTRDAMRLLIEKVESGQEKRKGVREAVEKMKAYLERREEERVGDWVKELTALAKPAAKKARLAADEQHVEDDYIKSETLRELTPPLTQHVPAGSLSTVSSISSLATATSAMRTDISPAVSLRSASSSSMSSTSSVLSKDFEFKPYQYNGTMSGYGVLNGGTKRELPTEMATSAEREQRFKHSAQVHSPQGYLPQWVTDPNYGGRPAPPPYFTQGYPPQQMGFHVGHAGPSSYPIYPQPQQVMYSYAPPAQYPYLGQGHPQQSSSGQPMGQGQGGNGGLWSSNAPMPLLSHMQVHQANTWQMPQQWEFRSPVGQWSQ